MPPIILASQSRYRRQLIEKLGINVISRPSNIDESRNPGETPEQLVKRLAITKAKTLSREFPHHLIVGCDQVADFNGEIITKPGDHEGAIKQLTTASEQTMTFLTGLCLLNSSNNYKQYQLCCYEVKFRQLNQQQIENYLRREQPYDCAGSFKSEGLGISLFEYIRGDDPNILVGLPLIALTHMLANEGVDVLS